jgi:hypothetical protein
LSDRELLQVAGRELAVSNPRKVLFPKPGYTKLDLVRQSGGEAPASSFSTREAAGCRRICSASKSSPPAVAITAAGRGSG